MKSRFSTGVCRAAFCAAVTALSSIARAETLPASFVPVSMCTSRPCDCSDIPMMEVYLANQKAAQAAWQSIANDIFAGKGPLSGAAAVTSFQGRFPGDPRVSAQFQTCPGYDPSINNLNKVAGVSQGGDILIDSCLCSAFCKDIATATVVHEQTHRPTIVAGVFGYGQYLIGCSLGLLSGYICNVIQPLILTQSELASYAAGISYLDSSLTKLEASDPANPSMACTWQPLATLSRPAGSERPPRSFFARLALLFERVVHGATS